MDGIVDRAFFNGLLGTACPPATPGPDSAPARFCSHPRAWPEWTGRKKTAGVCGDAGPCWGNTEIYNINRMTRLSGC